MLSIVLLFLGYKYPVVYMNSVVYGINKSENEFQSMTGSQGNKNFDLKEFYITP